MNPSLLTASVHDARLQDARLRASADRRAGDRRPRRRAARPSEPAAHPEHVLIRSAGPVDREALERLAQLDSAARPEGDALVAEVRGELVAAIGLRNGRAIADPFRPTADVVRLLELRAAQLRAAGDGTGALPLHAPEHRHGPLGTAAGGAIRLVRAARG